MDIVNFSAGLFLGVAVTLGAVVYVLVRINRALDRERKLWANRAMVREGRERLFDEAPLKRAARGGDPAAGSGKSGAQAQVTSPFRRGLRSLRDEIEERRTATIPEAIKNRIAAAAEAAGAARGAREGAADGE